MAQEARRTVKRTSTKTRTHTRALINPITVGSDINNNNDDDDDDATSRAQITPQQ